MPSLYATKKKAFELRRENKTASAQANQLNAMAPSLRAPSVNAGHNTGQSRQAFNRRKDYSVMNHQLQHQSKVYAENKRRYDQGFNESQRRYGQDFDLRKNDDIRRGNEDTRRQENHNYTKGRRPIIAAQNDATHNYNTARTKTLDGRNDQAYADNKPLRDSTRAIAGIRNERAIQNGGMNPNEIASMTGRFTPESISDYTQSELADISKLQLRPPTGSSARPKAPREGSIEMVAQQMGLPLDALYDKKGNYSEVGARIMDGVRDAVQNGASMEDAVKQIFGSQLPRMVSEAEESYKTKEGKDWTWGPFGVNDDTVAAQKQLQSLRGAQNRLFPQAQPSAESPAPQKQAGPARQITPWRQNVESQTKLQGLRDRGKHPAQATGTPTTLRPSNKPNHGGFYPEPANADEKRWVDDKAAVITQARRAITQSNLPQERKQQIQDLTQQLLAGLRGGKYFVPGREANQMASFGKHKRDDSTIKGGLGGFMPKTTPGQNTKNRELMDKAHQVLMALLKQG
ncbi:hypothetical protein BVY04_03740 [bacterium M21]|nr:hypothetical protein BVY04_03740 [bacterium M21]